MAIDENKLNELVGKVVGDVGAALSSIGVVIGDRLGLWKKLAAQGPLTPQQLAQSSETSERYVREWLNAQAAAGYLQYDPATQRFALSPEQAAAFADESSPAFMAGAFEIAAACWAATDQTTQHFRTGEGLAWGNQHPCLFQGTERFFRSAYIGNLVDSWLPALKGVVPKLEKGATVADVGCGVGASTILMAKAFPHSKFYGFDSHAESIALANRRAQANGVGERVTFQAANALDYPGRNYDLVTYFDCLHDMENPLGAARHTRETLAQDGTWMIVEPISSDRPEDNHTPVGRVYYSASTMLCVPHSLAFGGPALGAQAGMQRLREVIEGGGFKQLRRAIDTPFNMVLEARPN